jgi:hypothetical protein
MLDAEAEEPLLLLSEVKKHGVYIAARESGRPCVARCPDQRPPAPSTAAGRGMAPIQTPSWAAR